MGTSFVPNTPEAMSTLERLFGRPMPAGRDPEGALGGILASDNLGDMLQRAAEAGRDVDVRPIVALELDEYVNWSGDEWPDGLRERGRALVAQFRDADISRHVDRLVMPDTEAAASAEVARVVGFDPSLHRDRLESRRGFAAGSHVVKDTLTGDVYRTEAVYGVVFEATPTVRERVESELFTDESAPAP